MNQLVEQFGPNLPLLFKLHEIRSVDSQKIIEIVATRCQILRLKCTKFNFGWGSAPNPAGGAHSASPDLLAGFKGPTSNGREGKKGKEKDGRRWGGEEKKGDGRGGARDEGREKGEGRRGKGRDPESGLPQGPRWLSAGLQISLLR